MIITLIGYMGSGKSTIGKELAHVLNFTFIDLDDYIEVNEGITITEIFKTKGEIYFRKKEHNYLQSILNTENNIVLALGGGTPCYATNLEILLNESKVKLIYLKLSISFLAERLFKEKAHRPLINHLQTEDELIEFIGKHLFERSQFYNHAHYTINADDKTQKDIVAELLMSLI